MPNALSLSITDRIAVVTLDLPGEPVNLLSRRMRDELGPLLDRLEGEDVADAVVLISGKPDSFIAGADVEELLAVTSAEEAERLSRDGQRLLDRLELLQIPVVAAIHGACLGGGLEVALACSYRIATEHRRTSLGLPEVQLGLIPGAGGTQRLPRLVGLRSALDLILAGKAVRPRKALAIGLVNEVVHPAILRRIAIERAQELGSGDRQERGGRGRGAVDLLLDENPLGRSVVLRKARERTMAKTRGHYPAPLAALEVVSAGYVDGRVRGFQEEARHFGELAISPVARELMYLFFATTALKKDPGVDGAAPPSRTVDKLAVLGAGFMGAGIAAIGALNDTIVRLKDVDHARVGKGLAAVRDVGRERVKRKRMTEQELTDFQSLVSGAITYQGFGSVDLVIEAVYEDLALKHRVLREAESHIRPETIYATNTSTIPIADIAAAAVHPERVLGMHFFSPVHKMPLLEIIRGPATHDGAVVIAVAYGKRVGKTVIVVNDGPGFYTTRTLAAFMNEAGHLLDGGARIEPLDAALVAFGFPVGPITLLDEVGLDVAGKVTDILKEAFGARIRPSDTLTKVIEAGRLGRKGKQGFYEYDGAGKRGAVDKSVYALFPDGENANYPPDELQERTVLALVNEAARCLEDGVLRSARDGDVGAVMGFGFPPFLGGPFRWMDAQGIGDVVRRLELLQDRFGPRYTPAQLLVDMARRSRRFHP